MRKFFIASSVAVAAFAGFGCAEAKRPPSSGSNVDSNLGGTSSGHAGSGGSAAAGTSGGGTAGTTPGGAGGAGAGGQGGTGGIVEDPGGTGGAGGWCTNPIICPDNGSGEPCCVTSDGPCGYEDPDDPDLCIPDDPDV